MDPLGVALLPARRLRDLVLRAGVCLTADSLRHLVDGTRLRGLVNALGQEVYAFGLRRAPELAQALELPRHRADDDPDLPAEAVVRRRGVEMLAAVCAGMPAPVVNRVLLKLPRTWSDDLRSAQVLPDAAAATRLFRHLIDEGDHHACDRDDA